MKRSLCIGILKLTPTWKALLDQIGVCYEEVKPERLNIQTYSAVIVNRSVNGDHSPQIREYLKSGGNVVLINDDHGFFPDKSFSKIFSKRLRSDLNLNGFQHIPHLDLFTTIKTTGKATLSDALRFKKVMKGNVVFMGFDPAERLFDHRYIRKSFPSHFGQDPDEIVSRVSKGRVSDLFLQVLKEIHFSSHLPFIRKWTSPKEKPVFCFRIDSDYGDQIQMDKVYRLLRKHHLKATWFLHVQAHEDWLSHFSEYKDQEIALHGYRHGTGRSKKKVQENISKGLNKLNDSGFEVTGFCAPYGIYNVALEESLKQFDFTYTSEFTYAYDSLPMITPIDSLQIPIHPICTGSLNRKGYSTDEMKAYFLDMMDQKLRTYEPVIFYHHPMQAGLKLFDTVFGEANKRSLTNLTFREFSEFWKKRDKTTFRASFDGQSGQIEKISDTSTLFEVSFRHGDSQLIKGENSVFVPTNKPTIQYEYPERNNAMISSTSFIQKLKLLKTSILDFRNRERL